MRYIITGATGFIGQKIIADLLDRNENVIAIVHPYSKKIANLPDTKNLIVLACDMNDTKSLLTKLNENSINYADFFIHLAWMGTTGLDRSNKDLQDQNVRCSVRILDLANTLSCQAFFFAGSQAEYGNIKEQKVAEQNENNICFPKNEYGQAKLRFGKYLREYQTKTEMKIIHGRIFSIYGPQDQPKSLISQIIQNLENGTSINLGPCNHLWNFTYIDDISKMIISLLNSKASSGIYNLASSDTRLLKEFINLIIAHQDWKGMCRFNTRDENESDVPLIPNITKLKQYITVSETSFEEGIGDTIVALENQNQLKFK